MTREIKFRVWDKNNHRWLNGDGQYEINDTNIRQKLNEIFYSDHFIFQQYTGLKDRNGRDIYEGDIVNFRIEIGEHDWEKENGEVWFDTEFGQWLFGRTWIENLEFWDGYTLAQVNLDKESFEILGNIFDNPEMLKKKE